MNGKELFFDVNGQPAAGYLATPEQTDAPGVLVLHAWWGLNSVFRKLCDRLASNGFVAFAPDLNLGRVAKTIQEAEQVMSELPPERKQAVAAAAPVFLRARPEVRKEPLAVIGFSMGAAWSLGLASELPQDFQKVVLFYGAGEGDFAKMRAEVLGHFADNDEYESPEYIRAMEADLRQAGRNPTFHTYPNTLHWFFEDDRPEYDPEAARLAWSRTLAFLRK